MKPPTPATGKADRKLLQRFQALMRPAKKKMHRLSANVTGEEDWEVDEPQIRMSRAFAVMLVLHLVAVGGLFAFHVFGKDDRDAETNATRIAHESSQPLSLPPVASTAPVPAAAARAGSAPRAEVVADGAPDTELPQKHIFKAGETKELLAVKFRVTERELEDANRDMEFKTGEILTIPRAQRVIGGIPGKPEPANPPLALLAATPSDDVGHRDFALKSGADDPYAPVQPAELAAVTPERTSVRTKPVKAEPETTFVHSGKDEEASDERESRSAPAPKVKKTTTPPVTPAKPKPAATGSRTHVVGKGDTVYNVAKRYGLSPGEVLRANGISDPSKLQMGQVLKITVRR